MATISFIAKFDLSLNPLQFIGTDSTDYPVQSIATTNVNGCFRIIAPSGVTIYDNQDFSDNGCDIKVSTSVISQKVIPLIPELGNYTITYTVYDKNLAVYYILTSVFENLYVAPVIDIEQTVNVVASLYTQIDNTNYVITGITPTMVRVNKLVYPAGIQGGPPPPITTTSSILRTNVVYNGPATAIITNYVTYTFSDGLIVVANLYGSKVLLVDGAFYCSIVCGLESYSKKVSFCNLKLRDLYTANFNLACSYLVLVMAQINCNGGDDISGNLTKIKNIIGDCDCGCDDKDDNFGRITGWGTIIGVDGTNGINGTNGADGADGADGSVILTNTILNNATVYALGSGTPNTYTSYTLPINTLKTNGDILEIKVLARVVLPTSTSPSSIACFGADIGLTMNGNTLNTSISDATTGISHVIPIGTMATYVEINCVITRISATTIAVSFNVDEATATKLKLSTASFVWRESSVSVANLTTNTNVINVNVYSNAPLATAAANSFQIAITQLLIKYIAI